MGPSGVARVTGALGQTYILRPPPQKSIKKIEMSSIHYSTDYMYTYIGVAYMYILRLLT